jgi:hypothetical protein
MTVRSRKCYRHVFRSHLYRAGLLIPEEPDPTFVTLDEKVSRKL